MKKVEVLHLVQYYLLPVSLSFGKILYTSNGSKRIPFFFYCAAIDYWIICAIN